MKFIYEYKSFVSKILLASDEDSLTGLWLEGSKYYGKGLDVNSVYRETDVIKLTKSWLDIYFSGIKPDFNIPIKLTGTNFNLTVWMELLNISYGSTTSYGQVAKKVASKLSKKAMSAQAVGRAVGENPISIIIPCHRVIASNGFLRGYSAGLDKKLQLLRLEGLNIDDKLKVIF